MFPSDKQSKQTLLFPQSRLFFILPLALSPEIRSIYPPISTVIIFFTSSSFRTKCFRKSFFTLTTSFDLSDLHDCSILQLVCCPHLFFVITMLFYPSRWCCPTCEDEPTERKTLPSRRRHCSFQERRRETTYGYGGFLFY